MSTINSIMHDPCAKSTCLRRKKNQRLRNSLPALTIFDCAKLKQLKPITITMKISLDTILAAPVGILRRTSFYTIVAADDSSRRRASTSSGDISSDVRERDRGTKEGDLELTAVSMTGK